MLCKQRPDNTSSFKCSCGVASQLLDLHQPLAHSLFELQGQDSASFAQNIPSHFLEQQLLSHGARRKQCAGGLALCFRKRHDHRHQQAQHKDTHDTIRLCKLCSLNALLNDKCTATNDIPCRRCYFKACHKLGSVTNTQNPQKPTATSAEQFGRPFGPQDCDELNACLAFADCKDE